MANGEQEAAVGRSLKDIDPDLKRVFLPWILRHPRYIGAGPRLLRAVKAAGKLRAAHSMKGLMVPPFLILSMTSRCNLSCAGCFAAAAGHVRRGDGRPNGHKPYQLGHGQWRDIIAEASELGVFGFVMVGGEPFLMPGLLDLCREFKNRFFIIITNGTAISKENYKALSKLANVAVIVSIEGSPEMTDARRGAGVYVRAMDTLTRLNKLGVVNGVSVTITRVNFRYWMNEDNIDDLVHNGVRIGAFLEYIPTRPEDPDDMGLMLEPDESAEFRARMLYYRSNKSIYIVHSPGDEESFGGCVSAGRGFAHVTPGGDLTACPVSNMATHNRTTASLRDALASRLFEEIRANEHLLETEGMPCALFAHPKEVNELAVQVGAYRTDRV